MVDLTLLPHPPHLLAQVQGVFHPHSASGQRKDLWGQSVTDKSAQAPSRFSSYAMVSLGER